MKVMTPFLSTKVLFDSGPPPDKLATGTAISIDQHSAVYIPYTCTNCTFESAQLYVNSNLVKQNNQISLSLCKDLDEQYCCDRGDFELPPRKRIQIEWQSDCQLDGGSYWLIVKGNAPMEESFTWLDAPTFKATTAFWNGTDWTMEPLHRYGPTLVFTVRL